MHPPRRTTTGPAVRSYLLGRGKVVRCFAVRGARSGTGRIRSLVNQKESVEEVLDAESFYWQQASLWTVIERVTVHLGRQGHNLFDASQMVIAWRHV
ncbi:MAG: hypothetical protein WEE67_09985 [Chloroflexota bacterium]